MAKGLFPTYHPAVCMLFFVAAICFTFATMHPVYIVLSFLCACLYCAFLRGVARAVRAFAITIPIVAFVAIINSVMNVTGATKLWSFGPFSSTLEGVVYGVFMGLMLASVIMWFACYNEVMTEDKFTYLFGRVVPTMSLVVSMVSRWVPRTVARGQSIRAAQSSLIGGYDSSKKGMVGQGVRLMTVLAGLGMEDSIQTSDSMRARGYGTSRRTSYMRFSWHARERVVLVFLLAMIVINIIGMVMAVSGFVYYPRISAVVFNWGYIPFALMLVTPLLVEFERIA